MKKVYLKVLSLLLASLYFSPSYSSEDVETGAKVRVFFQISRPTIGQLFRQGATPEELVKRLTSGSGGITPDILEAVGPVPGDTFLEKMRYIRNKVNPNAANINAALVTVDAALGNPISFIQGINNINQILGQRTALINGEQARIDTTVAVGNLTQAVTNVRNVIPGLAPADTVLDGVNALNTTVAQKTAIIQTEQARVDDTVAAGDLTQAVTNVRNVIPGLAPADTVLVGVNGLNTTIGQRTALINGEQARIDTTVAVGDLTQAVTNVRNAIPGLAPTDTILDGVNNLVLIDPKINQLIAQANGIRGQSRSFGGDFPDPGEITTFDQALNFLTLTNLNS